MEAKQPDIVELVLNQDALACRIIERCLKVTLKSGRDPEEALEEIRRADEDMYYFAMDAAHAALEYFNQQILQLNEQTQKLSGEDIVIGGLEPATRRSDMH